jgi:phospho-N-acetylmuramoyl-pentapeptide-transferase
MELYLLTTLVSFLIHFLLIIPFINLLYKVKFQRAKQETKDAFNNPTPIFDQFHQHKSGTPVGGGILIIFLTTLLFLLFMWIFTLIDVPFISNYPSMFIEVKILLFTFISFGLLGMYDDINKTFFNKKKDFFGIRMRHKFLLEIILSVIIAYWLYAELQIDIINVPFMGVWEIGPLYILFAAFVIVAFTNAVNITDGLDGLASGVLMISLAGFWVVASSIIDVPTSLFIAILMGGLLAFIYFNVHPARLFLGDSGALSFGATFAVIGLILGKSFALPIIGGVFVVEIGTSLLQLLSKKFFKRKIFPVAPLHLWLQMKGWEESKIVMRFWVLAILCSLFGLMIAFMR